jgi:hypothetical protein
VLHVREAYLSLARAFRGFGLSIELDISEDDALVVALETDHGNCRVLVINKNHVLEDEVISCLIRDYASHLALVGNEP